MRNKKKIYLHLAQSVFSILVPCRVHVRRTNKICTKKEKFMQIHEINGEQNERLGQFVILINPFNSAADAKEKMKNMHEYMRFPYLMFSFVVFFQVFSSI